MIILMIDVIGEVRDRMPNNRPPLYEIPNVNFRGNPFQALKGIVPGEFTIGDNKQIGDIRFGFGVLPDDPTERNKVLDEIRNEGSLNTDPDINRKAMYMGLYERAAAVMANTDPRFVVSCTTSSELPNILENGITTVENAEGQLKRKLLYHPNVILVYDARERSDNGLKPITKSEYTFKNKEQRQRALIAVIRLI